MIAPSMVRLLNVAAEDPDMVLLVPLSLTVDELTTKVALLTQLPPILTLPVAESVPPEIVRSPSKVVVLFRDRVPAPVLVKLIVPLVFWISPAKLLVASLSPTVKV